MNDDTENVKDSGSLFKFEIESFESIVDESFKIVGDDVFELTSDDSFEILGEELFEGTGEESHDGKGECFNIPVFNEYLAREM